MGYSQDVGVRWNGDLLLVDANILNSADDVKPVNVKRIPATQVNIVKSRNSKFQFPCRSGKISQPEEPLQERRIRPFIEDEFSENEVWDDMAEDEVPEVETEPTVMPDQPQDQPPPCGSNEPAGDDSDALEQDDVWIVGTRTVTCEHRKPREALMKPTDEDITFPIPIQYVDVMRITETDLPDKAEARIEDHWTEPGRKVLSGPWRGRTRFTLRLPHPKPGHWYADGEEIQKKST